MGRAPGANIFRKFVEPYLLKWKPGMPVKGVYKGVVHDMPGMTVIKSFKYTKRDPLERALLRRKFNGSARKNFLKGLDPKMLAREGMSPSDIALIQRGRVPKGYSVHHKFPLDDSGTNHRSNLILLRNSPDHHLVTNHQRWVTSSIAAGKSLEIPWVTYPPRVSVWPSKSYGGAVPTIP